MAQLWVLLQQKYSYAFRQEYNRDDRCRQVAQGMWAAEFTRRGFFWDEVQHAAEWADTSTMSMISMAAFVGLIRELRGDNHPETKLGHASFRPAQEVLAGVLPELPVTEAEQERREQVGREALRSMKALF